LFVWNMNPLASCPQQARLRRALEREDLLTVVLDLFPTDTAALADYVLPAASFLEFDDLIASYFHLTLSAQVKVMQPLGDALPNQEIFRRLAGALDFKEPELYESDADMLSTLLSRSGLGVDFASLAAKGTIWVPSEPAVQFRGGRTDTCACCRRRTRGCSTRASAMWAGSAPGWDRRPLHFILRMPLPGVWRTATPPWCTTSRVDSYCASSRRASCRRASRSRTRAAGSAPMP